MRGLVFGAEMEGNNFALFLLVLSNLGIARLESKACRFGDLPILLETAAPKQYSSRHRRKAVSEGKVKRQNQTPVLSTIFRRTLRLPHGHLLRGEE